MKCTQKFFQLRFWGLNIILFAVVVSPVSALAAHGQDAGSISAAHKINSLAQRVIEHLTKGRQRTVLISPLSLGSQVAQLAEGAQGVTRADLLRLMGWPNDMSSSAMGRAMRSLASDEFTGNGVTLQMANALWVDRSAQVRASFSGLEKRYFDAVIKRIDFSDPNSVGSINKWVAQQTHDRIKNIVSDLDPSTRVIMTSALYFRVLWETPFDQAKTKPGRFRSAEGHYFIVPFMHRSAQMEYLARPGYQAVSLPFYGRNYSIVFVVPRDESAKGPDTAIDSGSAVYDPKRYEERKVHLYLPRLKLSSKGSLLRTLRSMAAVPFGDQADYGGISPSKLVIGKLIHQVTLSLDEKGVTVTAGTLSDIVLTGERIHPLPAVTVRIDRPFDFFIRDRATGAIVVIGHVIDPGTRVQPKSD